MKKYKVNYYKVFRNASIITLLVSLTMATIQLHTLGGW